MVGEKGVWRVVENGEEERKEDVAEARLEKTISRNGRF